MQERLIDAVETLEEAARQFGAAYNRYSETYRRAARRLSGQPGFQMGEFRGVIGVGRLDDLLIQRLRGLGMGTMLDEGRNIESTVGPEWVEKLTSVITRVVPASDDDAAA